MEVLDTSNAWEALETWKDWVSVGTVKVPMEALRSEPITDSLKRINNAKKQEEIKMETEELGDAEYFNRSTYELFQLLRKGKMEMEDYKYFLENAKVVNDFSDEEFATGGIVDLRYGIADLGYVNLNDITVCTG